MRHYFDGPPDPDLTSSKLIFQSAKNPLNHGSVLIAIQLGRTHLWLKFDSARQLRLRLGTGMDVNDRYMSKLAAGAMNGSRIISGIHQVVKIRDSL